MKKLIFLLLTLMVGVGMVFAEANPSHPHGDFPPEIVLAEFSAQQGVGTQPAVLVSAVPVTAWLPSFQAAMALYNESAIRPQGRAIPIINTGQLWTEPAVGIIAEAMAKTDYYLRC